MIVVDASAMLDLLLQTSRANDIDAHVLVFDQDLHAPHLLDVEIAAALRRLTRLRTLSADRAERVLADLDGIVIERHSHQDLVLRAWALRTSLSTYDAVYVALAEALDAPLLTSDARLGRSHGHRARIVVIS